ncbi:MAG TPA: ABC transporter substrate-binding protein [Thermotogota bacterium]|nr:ABC transporter substrate-binding protein [Thermotogota bacterium]HPR97405.1 ABC transporter substrate-binding protein [Thermotogota bacterium]
MKRLMILCFLCFIFVVSFSADDGNKIYIGLSYPAFFDDEIEFGKGFELAIETINHSGGIKGRELEAVFIDDEAAVAEGMKVAHAFIQDKRILTVIGHFNSRVAVVTSKIYNDAKMPFIAPCSTAPDLMREDYTTVFRTIPDDKRVMAYLLNFLKGEGYEKIAVYYADDDFGKGVVKSVEDSADELGLEVVDRTTVINSANIERVLSRWNALDAEVLVVAETYEWVKDIIKEIKKRNPKLLVVGTSSLDFPEYISYLGEYAEGTIIPTHYELNKSTKLNMDFVEAFQEKYHSDPDMYAAIAYDTLMLFKEAAENTSALTKEQIVKALGEIRDKKCVTGTLSCENGEFIGDNILLKMVINGEFVFVENIRSSDTY